MAASATFALKVGVWFRRGRLFMVSPDSLGTACPLSGRNSTYRLVQISETRSVLHPDKSRTRRVNRLQRTHHTMVQVQGLVLLCHQFDPLMQCLCCCRM